MDLHGGLSLTHHRPDVEKLTPSLTSLQMSYSPQWSEHAKLSTPEIYSVFVFTAQSLVHLFFTRQRGFFWCY